MSAKTRQRAVGGQKGEKMAEGKSTQNFGGYRNVKIKIKIGTVPMAETGLTFR